MSGQQISTSVTILNSLLGFQAVSLTNFETSAESVIAAGSKVEIASGFFTFASDDQPQASTWTAISTGSTAYITLTPSGTAGAQIVTSKYSSVVPVWSDSKQGWYLSAASTIRYVAGVTKGSATQYNAPFTMVANQERTIDSMVLRQDLTVGNDINLTGNIETHRTINVGSVGGNHLFANDMTEATVFTTIAGQFDIGDAVLVTGGIGITSGSTMIVAYANKISGINLSFFGLIVETGQWSQASFGSASGTVVHGISISW